MRFTAETPTGSRSGSSRDSWTWDFCWSRWTPAATRLRLPVRESWGVLVPEDSPLARREAVTPGDLADSPLILTTRELMRREMIRWFGPYADRIQVAASGNLPYNQTQLAREGLGIYLVIRLDCAYDGLRFVPLSPPLESGTVLAWKKTEVLSATAAALLRFAEKYVGEISDHPV